MPSADEYIQTAVTSATSPDERIHASISNGTELDIWFLPGAFDRYDDLELAHQLGRLGQILWVAYRRERDEAYRTANALTVDEAAAARRLASDDPRRQAYDEALNEVQGEGVSADGSVRIRTRGMLSWTIEFDQQTPRRLGEHAFVSQLRSAYQALLADREMKISMLKADHFDMGIPRRWREMMERLRADNNRQR